MNALRRACLISALTALLLGDFAVAPGAGQAGAVYTPLEAPDGDANSARSTDGDGNSRGARPDLASILGRDIRTRVEDDPGRIIDLLADRNGQVQAAVIEFGGFMGIGTRKIAVEWSALQFERSGKQPQVILDMSRDRLRKAPEYKPNEPEVVRKADR